MTLIKVLGIGSPFGDDTAGWKVAELLRQRVPEQSNVSIEIHDRPGVRLIELMSNAKTVFLVDAVTSGNQPGMIHRLENQDIYELNTVFSTHDMGVAQAVELARSLGELPETLILFGIEISISHEGLDEVNNAITLVTELIIDELKASPVTD